MLELSKVTSKNNYQWNMLKKKWERGYHEIYSKILIYGKKKMIVRNT